MPKERDKEQTFGDGPREADRLGAIGGWASGDPRSLLRLLPLRTVSSHQMGYCYGRCKNFKNYVYVALKVYEKLLHKFLNSKLS